MDQFQMRRYLREQLKDQGLQYGDQIEIHPFQGKRQSIPLKRTKISLNFRNRRFMRTEGVAWKLPAVTDEAFVVDLIGVKTKLDQQDGSDLCFKLVSNDYFLLNGNLVKDAFVERGDQLVVGYTLISFGTKKEEKKQQLTLPEKICRSHLNLVLQGHSGVGKTRLAKIVHEHSGRVGSFVHLNLASLSPTLIESELFGHTKGAFTGAIQDRVGAFKQANYGTLFLDEIDSLPMDLQTKLLLFLEDFMIRPVGSSRSEQVDVRLIFATGKDLQQLVDQGKMRPDFRFRLMSGFFHRLPSLKESEILRKEMIEQMEQDFNCLLSAPLRRVYLAYHWPGNIRQLKSHFAKKLVFQKSRKWDYCEIDQSLTDEEAVNCHDFFNREMIGVEMATLKREYTRRVFHRCRAHIGETAKVLNVSPNTVRRILKIEKSG